MVGAGRDNAVDSGPGTEIYVVSGHAPRQLDRNVALFGRVVHGMELLAVMPRGPAPMGFYTKAEERVPIREIRVAADVPADQRTKLELLRTDTQTFTDLIEARRNRQDEWYKHQAGRIDVCNVPLPVRLASKLPVSSSSERPMISRMISLLPARMRLMRAPVYRREIGYSSM